MEIMIVAVIAVVAIAAALAGGWLLWRHRSLRRRFGPEYHRLAREEGALTADRKLRERERRHAELPLRDLDDQTREQYRAAWTEVQNRFVDTPESALGEADELVTRLIAERGYPTDDYHEELASLSVDHAQTLEHYRAGRDINLRHLRGEASTEEIRQALVHYRALFADLLGEDPVGHAGHAEPRRSRAMIRTCGWSSAG